jgi:hypothetical protein
MAVTMSGAAKRLYDPGKALGEAKGVPTTRQSSAPVALDLASFRLPGGVEVNPSRFSHFTRVLSDLRDRVHRDPKALDAAIHDAGQQLLELHITEQKALDSGLRRELDQPAVERWSKTRKRWRDAFANDVELGRNRRETTLTRVRALIDAYGEDAGPKPLADLKAYFNDGFGDHPELIRFLTWCAAKLAAKAR